MLELPAELIALREETLRFARTLVRDQRRADAEESFWREGWQRCAQQGLLGLNMPVELGGAGSGALAVAVAFEALGEGCDDNGLAFGLASQLSSCQMPILLHGTPAVRERYLRGLIEGKLIAAHAASEPDAGSDVTRILTRARKAEGGFRVTGSKTFSSLAPVSDLAIVLARGDDDSLVELVIPRDQYKVSTQMAKIGLRTSPISEVILDDAFVPDDHVLGGTGSGLMKFMTTMEWERLVIMASSVGAMKRQLDACVAYARERQQFGQAIGKFQAVSHRIAEMKLRHETSRLLLHHAAAKKDASGRATIESALVKLHVSESRYANALDAVRVFGGYGVTVENQVERELRDAVPGLIYAGTSDIQRNTIARLLGLPG
jgi:alkylation response protein AidB-like acyl-CoA dehydrogenase